jgi:hypothetical protein
MRRIVSLILMASGLLMIVVLRHSYAHTVTMIRATEAVAGTGAALLLIGQLLAPLLKIAAGGGLAAVQRWARPVAIAACALDIVVLGISILRFNGIGTDAVLREEIRSAGMTVVASSSILPVYAVWIASVVCLALMFTKPMRGGGQEEPAAA